MSLLEKMEAPLKFLPRWCLSDVISVFNCTLSVAQLVPMEHGRSWFWFFSGPLRLWGILHWCIDVFQWHMCGLNSADKAYILVWRDWTRAQKSLGKKWPHVTSCPSVSSMGCGRGLVSGESYCLSGQRQSPDGWLGVLMKRNLCFSPAVKICFCLLIGLYL